LRVEASPSSAKDGYGFHSLSIRNDDGCSGDPPAGSKLVRNKLDGMAFIRNLFHLAMASTIYIAPRRQVRKEFKPQIFAEKHFFN
jgi:hypothetical protein